MRKRNWQIFKLVVSFSLVLNLFMIGFMWYEFGPEFILALVPVTQILFHVFNLRLYNFHRRNNELADWSTDVCHTFLAIVTAFFTYLFSSLFIAAIKDFRHYNYNGRCFTAKQYLMLVTIILAIISNLCTIIASLLLRRYIRMNSRKADNGFIGDSQ
ncbi:MAG: hypothetical protein V4722_14345 [Bacteroidota bacterium]